MPEKMKFIRKNGRIIPIGTKGKKDPAKKSSGLTKDQHTRNLKKSISSKIKVGKNNKIIKKSNFRNRMVGGLGMAAGFFAGRSLVEKGLGMAIGTTTALVAFGTNKGNKAREENERHRTEIKALKGSSV